ncbi:RIP metalloprotease RseP [Brevirhabdus pacifica]|uniref:Zinc metalloprotease n=1 Tax=Brevirhabdus pacifica TaxID=1267768 RepID=A0A1U7DFH4_9RHOB|nr:RIP metalloprotease RseP [Brevirhabdus pacifica]APX88711.1 RIP metalloprotease RseP [Brevirhabdus pacifica]OWU79972.1 zinc metalloprotease [Loktanella sp. 22II-4b]PJJ86774.1 regulator of sigma E protease [Brevirhabdus pacifica]
MIDMLPSFGGFLGTFGAFILALSIIVAIHEYGHYIVGRWCGIHAEVFSLGFGPVLFSTFDKHGTRWQLAALPFGGYVKFLGDADAASGKDGSQISEMTPEEAKRTMHGAALWRRSATVAAGPVFNFILSIVVFAGVMWTQGVAVETPTVGSLKTLPQEQSALQEGDEILAVDGKEVADFGELFTLTDTLDLGPVEYTVRRDGEVTEVTGPFPMPARIDQIHPKSAAMDVGLEVGDVIQTIEGKPITAFRELRQIVEVSEGRPLLMSVWRDGKTFDVTLVPQRRDLPLPEGGFETRYLIGVSGGLFFEPLTETPGPFEAVGYGIQQTWSIVKSSLSGLAHIVTGAISSCNLQGPLGIAETSGAAASQGVQSFVWFIAVLSTAVGLLNLFPVPVLDGGHLVFHAYEAVVGKPPTDRALRVFFAVGLAFIVTLMVFALSNDIFCP